MAEKIKRIVDGVETEIEAARVFVSDDDLQNFIKSENSKGKGEILKTLGVTSVDEAKTKMGAQSKVDELTNTVEILKKETKVTRNKLYATELGIKPELVDKVIILADVAFEEGKDYKEVMKQEAIAIGALDLKGNPIKEKPQTSGMGKTDTSEKQLTKEEDERLAKLRDL